MKTKVINRNKRNKNNVTFKKMNCSPIENYDYTCYNNKSLIKLKHYWNIRHPDKLIKSNNPYTIWNTLRMNLQDVCINERCWLKQKFIENNLDSVLKNYTFSPKKPNTWIKNKNEWLSSVDIIKVMKQYEHAYNNFIFIGPSPIDFDKKMVDSKCVWEELCKFDLKKYLLNKKNIIGIIFNTDPHYKSGSHWISMIIDISKKIIYYFDSNGNYIPSQIKKLVDRIIDQGKDININFTFKQNYPKEHQKKNTECGIYVLYFISEILKGNKNYDYFSKYRIKDIDMEKYRDIFFNN